MFFCPRWFISRHTVAVILLFLGLLLLFRFGQSTNARRFSCRLLEVIEVIEFVAFLFEESLEEATQVLVVRLLVKL